MRQDEDGKDGTATGSGSVATGMGDADMAANNGSEESILSSGRRKERIEGGKSTFGGINKRMDVEISFHHET